MTQAPKPGRQDRRKARTRQALIHSAQVLLARGDWPGASIKEITDGADLGFGTFYNHFTGKQELLDVTLADVADEYGALMDEHVAGMDDAAEAFATCVRLTGRMVSTHPQTISIITNTGMSALTAPTGLAPRALRDITRGIESGRFTVANPLVALAAAGGSLLALMHLSLVMPDAVDASAYDELAELLLQMYGVPRAAARAIAHQPLPVIDPTVPISRTARA